VHAWHHLQHFFSWLFHSRESSAGFVGAILGAVIGGLMTVCAAILAQRQAARDQRRRDRETEIENIRGILEANVTEVELFKNLFLNGFEDAFMEPDSSRPFGHLPQIVSLSQSLSTVFDSNAAVLGRISDAPLRHKIVATYIKLKAIVDIVNHYAKRREFFEDIRSHTNPNQLGRAVEVKGELEKWAKNIRRYIPELQAEIADLLVEIRKYLDG
jgi:hypothetical protein